MKSKKILPRLNTNDVGDFSVESGMRSQRLADMSHNKLSYRDYISDDLKKPKEVLISFESHKHSMPSLAPPSKLRQNMANVPSKTFMRTPQVHLQVKHVASTPIDVKSTNLKNSRHDENYDASTQDALNH